MLHVLSKLLAPQFLARGTFTIQAHPPIRRNLISMIKWIQVLVITGNIHIINVLKATSILNKNQKHLLRENSYPGYKSIRIINHITISNIDETRTHKRIKSGNKCATQLPVVMTIGFMSQPKVVYEVYEKCLAHHL